MNQELVAVLDYMERERGIERETLFVAVEQALLSASKKSVSPAKDVRIVMDRKTCAIKAFARVQVVALVKAPYDEITLAAAQKLKPAAVLGEFLEVEVTPKDFGRIAAQTAKQAILHKIRQAEKDKVFDEYKGRAGEIVSGTVRRFERSDVIVDLGRGEAKLSSKERVPTEEYQVGDRIRALILSVDNTPNGAEIVLSRSHPDFVRRLFELEVSEISDKTVEIKGLAREAGFRSKLAVISKDQKVDPVGACVGMKGIRVKNIVRELSGEKIDIVRWSDDIRTFVTNALSPAKLLNIEVDERGKGVMVIVDPDQLSLAIGKKGQNARLTSKLTGWRIDIRKDETQVGFEEKVAQATAELAKIAGIGPDRAKKLVEAGFLNLEGIVSAEISDLEAVEGFDTATATDVRAAAEMACAASVGGAEAPAAEAPVASEVQEEQTAETAGEQGP